MTEPIPSTRAILIATPSGPGDAGYERFFGGETLLNRSLIALSKAGVTRVEIIVAIGEREKATKMIQTVNQSRLTLSYGIRETSDKLSDIIASVTADWSETFLVMDVSALYHPTFLKQAVVGPAAPAIIVLDDTTVRQDQLIPGSSFKEKFRVIYSRLGQLNKVRDANDVVQEKSPSLTNGRVSTDVLRLKAADLEGKTYETLTELTDQLIKNGMLMVQGVREAWWLRVFNDTTKSEADAYFWKIAFKEISGEFSKAVNSKMSKPLSLWFAHHGVAPNTLSNLQLFGYILGSAFLFLDAYWGMSAFAVIWQFSAGVLDRCDGEVARIRNYESEAGAKFDVLVDDLRFGLPYFVLIWVCFHDSGDNWLFVGTAGFVLAWFLYFTFAEMAFMREAGYLSRQVMNVDYLKMVAKPESGGLLKKLQPFFKGDVRTFAIFLMSFYGNKFILFWMLSVYAFLLGIISYIGVSGFRKVFAAKGFTRK